MPVFYKIEWILEGANIILNLARHFELQDSKLKIW